MNRRSFFRFLAVAPVALPAAVVAASKARASDILGGARTYRRFELRELSSMNFVSKKMGVLTVTGDGLIEEPVWIINRHLGREFGCGGDSGVWKNGKLIGMT